MKKIHLLYIILLIASCALTSCKSVYYGFSVSPSKQVVKADRKGRAIVNLRVRVPKNVFTRRTRFILVPQLAAKGKVMEELTPIVVEAPLYTRKQRRREALSGHRLRDPYAAQAVTRPGGKTLRFPYHAAITLPEGVDTVTLQAVATTDGCSECTTFHTMTLATLVRSEFPPEEKPEEEYEEIWEEVTHQGRGEARLQFIVDKWNIVLDMANNRAELMAMKDSLQAVFDNPNCKLTSLSISGSASAEAPYQHNVMLSRNRAASAKNWLINEMQLPDSVTALITSDAAPEGWEPVVQAMGAANDADSILVRSLMIRYPGPTDDAAEKHIRRLPCWAHILREYLPADRRVIYEWTWSELTPRRVLKQQQKPQGNYDSEDYRARYYRNSNYKPGLYLDNMEQDQERTEKEYERWNNGGFKDDVIIKRK